LFSFSAVGGRGEWSRLQRLHHLNPHYGVIRAEAGSSTGPWINKYPTITQSWRRNWEQIIPFYNFAPELRNNIYATDAIESLHMQLRKVA
jgi:transposase-like protein